MKRPPMKGESFLGFAPIARFSARDVVELYSESLAALMTG